MFGYATYRQSSLGDEYDRKKDTLRIRPWEQKEVPWCTICLVIMAVTCHFFVLLGNMRTASSMYDIGTSTGGWSGVGLDLSAALRVELDEIMKNVTAQLTDSINRTMHVQEMIDVMLALVGNATDNMGGSNVTKAMFLLQSHHISHAVQHGYADDGPVGGMTGIITGTVDQMLDQLMSKVSDALDQLLVVIKPALQQVGAFITKFGSKVQDILQSFSVTMDKVQKIFDQVMSSMSQKGEGKEDLLHNTFTLFDVSHTGGISADDLKLVAQTYKISALQGSKSEKLVAKYDVDNSSDLDKEEYAGMVDDASVPDIMPVVLRTFSARLAEVAGQLAESKFRDEIAQNVVSYFQLMGAKNMTKVHWVSDALTNGSLPSQFTSDVMVQLALAVDDPNVLTTVDIGQVTISTMMELHAKNTLECVEQLSDPEYWHSEGYNPQDQPTVVERVTRWVVNSSSAFLQILPDKTTDDDSSNVLLVDQSVRDSMPSIAKRLSARRMKVHVAKLDAARHAHYSKLYTSKTSQKLLLHLLGGTHAAETSSSSPAARAVRSGVPAKPETLQFAKWLSWNATDTAARFQGYCFKNTATSSNSIDDFALVIQGMVKKIQSFIKMMEKYSTPAGIEMLESKVQRFARHGLKDVAKLVKGTINDMLNESAPLIEDSLHSAVHNAGDDLGHMIGKAIGTPIGQSLKPVISSAFGKMFGNASANAGDVLGGDLANILGSKISDISGDALGEKLGGLVEDLMTNSLEAASGALEGISPSSSLLQTPFADLFGPLHVHLTKFANSTADRESASAFEQEVRQALQHAERTVQLAYAERKQRLIRDQDQPVRLNSMYSNLGQHGIDPPTRQMSLTGCDPGVCAAPVVKFMDLDAELELEDPTAMSGVWTQMTGLLKSLTNLLPLATDNLKFARKEVSKLAKSLDSVFETFADKGSGIFDKIGSMWRTVWILYFCLICPLTCALLFYAFWAGGYFGGPGMPPSGGGNNDERYSGICGSLLACCDTCCSCVRNCHDTHLCFWSLLVILQIFALGMFLVSLFFVLFAGIKMFIASGCASIYILGDGAICSSTLLSLRSFLASFMGETPEETFSHVCDRNQLLTCGVIGNQMKMSGIFSAAGSFLAAILSFQLLIESSSLHTRAVERRRLAYLFAEDQK